MQLKAIQEGAYELKYPTELLGPYNDSWEAHSKPKQKEMCEPAAENVGVSRDISLIVCP